MDLVNRPRRLRRTDAIRRMNRETRLSPDALIYPIFVDETLSGVRPYPQPSGTEPLRSGQRVPGCGRVPGAWGEALHPLRASS